MISKQRRVVVTGVGTICPMGNSKEALWKGLAHGQSGVGPLAVVPPDCAKVTIAAETRDFSGAIDDFGPLDKERKKAIRKGLKMMNRECQIGVASAQLALHDANLDPSSVAPERTGIAFGSDYMLTTPEDYAEGIKQCMDEAGEFHFPQWAPDGMPKMSPLWLLKYLPNMPASHMAIYNQFYGPNNSLTLREATALAAIGEAYQVIVRGSADTMLAGATGTRLHPVKMVHAITQEEVAQGNGEPARASRPFDRNRTGMVLGEGAGILVLEELATAEARGATIYGELVGGATASAAGRDGIARRRRAMANVLRAVLRLSGVEDLDSVGFLHAHGLSTRTCDIEEAQAIQEVFGQREKPLPVTAAKSYFGNLGAGGGAVELIASLLAMQNNRLFPILNYETPDPECPIAAVTDPDTPAGDSFIGLNVTPQGQAAAVMVRRFS